MMIKREDAPKTPHRDAWAKAYVLRAETLGTTVEDEVWAARERQQNDRNRLRREMRTAMRRLSEVFYAPVTPFPWERGATNCTSRRDAADEPSAADVLARAHETLGGTIQACEQTLQAIRDHYDSHLREAGFPMPPGRGPRWVSNFNAIGDLMPLGEFLEAVDNGSIIDDDGTGEWATETHHDASRLVDVSNPVPPPWATHVLWSGN